MPKREPEDQDHRELFAHSMDLSIEGYRLIAHEIGHEMEALWRAARSWWRGLLARRRDAPPV
jgi:hypothetical protein